MITIGCVIHDNDVSAKSFRTDAEFAEWLDQLKNEAESDKLSRVTIEIDFAENEHDIGGILKTPIKYVERLTIKSHPNFSPKLLPKDVIIYDLSLIGTTITDFEGFGDRSIDGLKFEKSTIRNPISVTNPEIELIEIIETDGEVFVKDCPDLYEIRVVSSPIPHIDNVDIARLRISNVNGLSLRDLKEYDGIRNLEITSTEISDDSVTFEAFEHLYWLIINNCKIKQFSSDAFSHSIFDRISITSTPMERLSVSFNPSSNGRFEIGKNEGLKSIEINKTGNGLIRSINVYGQNGLERLSVNADMIDTLSFHEMEIEDTADLIPDIPIRTISISKSSIKQFTVKNEYLYGIILNEVEAESASFDTPRLRRLRVFQCDFSRLKIPENIPSLMEIDIVSCPVKKLSEIPAQSSVRSVRIELENSNDVIELDVNIGEKFPNIDDLDLWGRINVYDIPRIIDKHIWRLFIHLRRNDFADQYGIRSDIEYNTITKLRNEYERYKEVISNVDRIFNEDLSEWDRDIILSYVIDSIGDPSSPIPKETLERIAEKYPQLAEIIKG